MSNREFRTHESYEAESITRNMIPDFLRSKGFHKVRDDRKLHGATESQVIHATSSSGDQLTMRVKLCWRPRNKKKTYSAVQLLAKIKNGDWKGTLQQFVDRARRDSTTHFLLVQREDQEITFAALVPISELLTIWWAQHDLSASLIKLEKLGRRKKNHAMNGSSPTLWLHDPEAPGVTAALWNQPGVLDIVQMKPSNVSEQEEKDDTYDDIPGLDYSLFGSDGAEKIVTTRSYVKRDQRVRKAVLQRAKGQCEREGCRAHRHYSGFLDVHHILGVEKSDRFWNCIAVCPNCHREAHTAPNRDQINLDMLNLVIKFKDRNVSCASA